MIDDKYVVIFEKGRAENYHDKTYHDILDVIYLNFMQGCYQGDYPNMLLRNGKIIVLSGLHDIAYRFGNYKRDKQIETRMNIIAMFPEPDTREEE